MLTRRPCPRDPRSHAESAWLQGSDGHARSRTFLLVALFGDAWEHRWEHQRARTPSPAIGRAQSNGALPQTASPCSASDIVRRPEARDRAGTPGTSLRLASSPRPEPSHCRCRMSLDDRRPCRCGRDRQCLSLRCFTSSVGADYGHRQSTTCERQPPIGWGVHATAPAGIGHLGTRHRCDMPGGGQLVPTGGRSRVR